MFDVSHPRTLIDVSSLRCTQLKKKCVDSWERDHREFVLTHVVVYHVTTASNIFAARSRRWWQLSPASIIGNSRFEMGGGHNGRWSFKQPRATSHFSQSVVPTPRFTKYAQNCTNFDFYSFFFDIKGADIQIHLLNRTGYPGTDTTYRCIGA